MERPPRWIGFLAQGHCSWPLQDSEVIRLTKRQQGITGPISINPCTVSSGAVSSHCCRISTFSIPEDVSVATKVPLEKPVKTHTEEETRLSGPGFIHRSDLLYGSIRSPTSRQRGQTFYLFPYSDGVPGSGRNACVEAFQIAPALATRVGVGY